MNILLTGSSGQLGQAIAADLSRDHTVTGFDLLPGPFTGLRASIADRQAIRSALAGKDAVIHVASLHARHLSTHTAADFIDTNLHGLNHLLEGCAALGVKRLIYTSTTSLYGDAMLPQGKAAWVTEELRPIPRDIYDITKIAAEDLCRTFTRQHDLAVVSLRVSRFFPEPERLVAIYRAYRGVDVRDVARAHRLALEAGLPGYQVFNISARSPFRQPDREELLLDAPAVLARYYPAIREIFAHRGWELPRSIDRVYRIDRAATILGYHPLYNFDSLFPELAPAQLPVSRPTDPSHS